MADTAAEPAPPREADAPNDSAPGPIDPEEVQHLAYACPHCGATVKASEVLAGDRIDCPRCQKPFELGVPVAQPLRPDQLRGEPDYQVDAGGGDTEEVVLVTHPAAFRCRPGKTLLAGLAVLAGLVALLFAAGVGIGVGLLEPVSGAVGGTILAAAGGALILAGLVPMAWWFAKSRVETLTITSQRTTFRWGIVSRETTEVQHDDVRNLQVDQSFAGRLLGVGDLFLSSSGQDELEIHAIGIPRPEKAADVVRDLQ